MRKKPARKRAPPKRRAPRKPTDPGAVFCAAVEKALRSGELRTIPDAVLRRVLTAAVKAYAAKSEEAETELPIFETNSVTATETVVAACAMIRAADLNPFDLAMWFRRPLAVPTDQWGKPR